MINNLSHHHVNKRKQVYQNLAEYPHPNKYVRFLDTLITLGAIIGPLMTIPQIYQIISVGSARGVSSLTWFLYGIFQTPWLVYGFVHRERPIMISAFMWIVFDIAVAIAAIAYP